MSEPKAVDDFAFIAKRLKEIQTERDMEAQRSKENDTAPINDQEVYDAIYGDQIQDYNI